MSTGARVVRLGAWCDVDDFTWRMRTEGRPVRTFSVQVHEFAVLADDRRLTLHRDRGWNGQLMILGDDDGTVSHDYWDHLTEEGIRSDALNTVPPDMLADGTEPAEEHPYDWLAQLLAQHDVHVSPDELRGLPYDVELGPHLREHFGDDAAASPPIS